MSTYSPKVSKIDEDVLVLSLSLCQTFLILSICEVCEYLTCEFLAEWRCDGSGSDQSCLADVFQILDFRHTVMIDKVIVFFGCSESSVDLVTQVLNAHVFVIARCHCLHQLCCVLEASSEERRWRKTFPS